MSSQQNSEWVIPNFFTGLRPPLRNRSRFHLIAIILLSVTLLLTLLSSPARAAGPCTCKDLDKIKEHLDRAAASEEAWKEIFAWARELYPGVDLPNSNDDLNQKFVQLNGAPKAQWRDIIKEGPAKEKKALKKVAGLNEKGEPVVDDDFQKNNCDDVIDAEKVHERAHRDFYLSPIKLPEGAIMASRALRLRAESEVESYRAQKTFLEKKLAEMKLKCLTLDKSAKLLLQEQAAQRERLNQAELRVRLLGTAQPGK
jgi:hypothetical protein